MAYNIKRLHTVLGGIVPAGVQAAQVAVARAVAVAMWLVALVGRRSRPLARAAAQIASASGSASIRAAVVCLLELSPTGC